MIKICHFIEPWCPLNELLRNVHLNMCILKMCILKVMHIAYEMPKDLFIYGKLCVLGSEDDN